MVFFEWGGVLKPAAPLLLGNVLKVQILGFPFQTLNPDPCTLIPAICAPNVTQLIQCGFGTEPHPWCLGEVVQDASTTIIRIDKIFHSLGILLLG